MVENLLIRLKNFHYIPYDITHQREFCGTFVLTTKSTGNLVKVPFDSHSRFDGIFVVLFKKVPRNIFNNFVVRRYLRTYVFCGIPY